MGRGAAQLDVVSFSLFSSFLHHQATVAILTQAVEGASAPTRLSPLRASIASSPSSLALLTPQL